MSGFYTEADYESSVIELFQNMGYQHVYAPDLERDFRSPLYEDELDDAIHRLNPTLPEEAISDALYKLKNFENAELVQKNELFMEYLQYGIEVRYFVGNEERSGRVYLVDYKNPDRNSFIIANQWSFVENSTKRPDILLFLNGLPIVLMELKSPSREETDASEAYTQIRNYMHEIPSMFIYNCICVMSDQLTSKAGTITSGEDRFMEWKTKDGDYENTQHAQFDTFFEGIFQKERLLDIIKNFICFSNEGTKQAKILAGYHQYFAVKKAIESTKKATQTDGKGGVFWHTQGSGKSYSMVMFARKVKRKMTGNFTFLIITDRDDLDTQIHKNFVRTEVIGPKDECQPKNSEQLREFLQKNKEFVFTLIHKFRYDKTKKYPVLSTRNDIFVLVDEAHRTQYKDLAENMRAALPNANFIAFTGTPLLGTKRLTNQWFGDYVSEYNFAQSVEDGSTVPLFYSRRVPEVGLNNDFLDDDVVDIIEDENLNEDETRLLENSASRILEVIKRDDRLDKIAQDIAHHFPRRGFLGKGMVVSVDKFTAVTMYNKVQHYWTEEKKTIIAERNAADSKEKRDELTKMLDYMNNVEMAVIVSEEADENKKFAEKGLDISIHRAKMNAVTVDGKDIEDRFKDPNDKLQLVFVCAMWLTGFDVKNLSTLYLDKPMKSHTLMQAIARANRVYPNKPCGIIVDYVNVFKYMKKALSDYAIPDDDDVMPAKNIEDLLNLLDSSINEGDLFLQSLGISLDKICAESSTFDKLDALRSAYNVIVANDESKDKFKVITNTMINLYEASKPEVFELHWENDKFAPLAYINGLMHNKIDDEKIQRARNRMANVLDSSVSSSTAEESEQQFAIHGTKVIDLSKINVEELRAEIKKAVYKAIEIDDLKAFIEKALQEMISKNCTRMQFSQRYKGIIDRYNAGGSENEDYYEQLVKLLEELKNEQNRPNTEGLTEEELEIYDLLVKGKKLTQAEEQKVKLAAKNLYNKLTIDKDELLVVDWYKDDQPKLKVKSAIESALDKDLPESYDKEAFEAKTNLLLNHFIDMAIQGYGWIAA